MSDDPTSPPPDYAVGYGRPPPQTRFKKGQSGNPKGRPKSHGPVEVDLAALRTAPVTVMQEGTPRKMPAKEVELRTLLAKAVKGDMRSIRYLLEQFLKYRVMAPPKRASAGGVVHIPNSMPFEMGTLILEQFGPPPWTRQEINAGRVRYLATRSEAQRRNDDRVGYDDL